MRVAAFEDRVGLLGQSRLQVVAPRRCRRGRRRRSGRRNRSASWRFEGGDVGGAAWSLLAGRQGSFGYVLLHRFTPSSNQAKRVRSYCDCILTRGIVRIKHLTICYVKRTIWEGMTTARARNYAGLSARGAAGGPARAADRGGDPRLWRTRIPQHHGEGRVRGRGAYRAIFLQILCQQRGVAGRRLRHRVAAGVQLPGGSPQGTQRRDAPRNAAMPCCGPITRC